jgi:hypothetical protein
MDLSKLPKLSQTPSPAASEPVEKSPEPVLPLAAEVSIGPEIWFNTIMGLIAVFWGFSFPRYLFDEMIGRTFHTNVTWMSGPLTGQEVPYPQLEGHVMLTDAGVFIFGVVILLEALVRVLWARGMRLPASLAGFVWIAAIVSTIFNLVVCGIFLSEGGVPITSGVAAAFGGFIIADMRRAMLVHRAFAHR